MTRGSLQQRIVTTFTIQAIIMALLACIATLFAFKFVEQELLYEHLDDYLSGYVQGLSQGRQPVTTPSIDIYAAGEAPAFARELPPGGHEIILQDGRSFHVLVRHLDNNRFTLLQDQTDFEQAELTILGVTFLVLLALSVGCYYFSKTLARRVIEPLITLSHQVERLSFDPHDTLTPDDTNDEVGLLARTIARYIARLKEFLQRERWFTGDISHELRTPMMEITSSLDVMLQDPALTNSQRQLCGTISQASGRINELIDTFLLLARQQPAHQTGRDLSDNMTAIADPVIAKVLPDAGARQLALDADLATPLASPVSPSMVQIALINLLKNAINSTEKGEILVRSNSHSLTVSDTGIGISSEICELINGDQHKRVPSRNNQLGLGLSIVKRVCEHEQWQLHCTSELNLGTTLVIHFQEGPAIATP